MGGLSIVICIRNLVFFQSSLSTSIYIYLIVNIHFPTWSTLNKYTINIVYMEEEWMGEETCDESQNCASLQSLVRNNAGWSRLRACGGSCRLSWWSHPFVYYTEILPTNKSQLTQTGICASRKGDGWPGEALLHREVHFFRVQPTSVCSLANTHSCSASIETHG